MNPNPNNMKSIILGLLIVCFQAVALNAQISKSGIFRTANDFLSHNLEYATPCSDPEHKIFIDPLFKRYQMMVRYNGEVHYLNKDSIYAVQYCSGAVERLFQRKTYSMVNPKEAILVYKVTTTQITKGHPILISWYFSKDANSPVQQLTIQNLLRAFPDNDVFHDAIMAEFKTDDELNRYDTMHKMMRINRLFENSKK